MTRTSSTAAPKLRRGIFIFTSSRQHIMNDLDARRGPDTALHGLNYLVGMDDVVIPSKSLVGLLRIPMLLRYRVIIAQDNFLLGYVVSLCARLFQLPTRWVYLAIHSSTLIQKHADHPIQRFILKTWWGSYSRIICISSEQRVDLINLGIPEARLVYIPFGIDADFFRPTRAHEEDFILSVGRDAGRDYETLIKAASRLPYRFVIVASPRNISEEWDIPANVTILYDQDSMTIRDLYQRARLVVVTSKTVAVPQGSDCSGQTVILDALASQKAVVTTHRSWVSDYFIPGEDLSVVPVGDIDGLVRELEALFSDSARRQRLADSGHQKVSRLYTSQVFAQAIDRLIQTLL